MISELIKNDARMVDEDLYQRIRTLNQFGVVGFIKLSDFQTVLQFLKKKGAEVEYNDRLIIWLPEISEVLKTTFKRK